MNRLLVLMACLVLACEAVALTPSVMPDPLPKALKECHLVDKDPGFGWCLPPRAIYECTERGVMVIIMRKEQAEGTCLEVRVFYPPGTWSRAGGPSWEPKTPKPKE